MSKAQAIKMLVTLFFDEIDRDQASLINWIVDNGCSFEEMLEAVLALDSKE